MPSDNIANNVTHTASASSIQRQFDTAWVDSQDIRLRTICKDREPRTNELLHPSNDFYGNATILKRYAGIKEPYPLRAAIEHGIFLGENFAWNVDLCSPLPGLITLSNYRRDILKTKTNKSILAIGPYIHYASPHMDAASLAKEKERLGRSVLVFPAHSSHHCLSEYDVDAFCSQLEKHTVGYDSVRICLYWKDVLRGHASFYLRRGYECVSAGHMYDHHFLSRLRSYLMQADLTVMNSITTGLGYSIYLNIPTILIQQTVHYVAASAESTRFMKDITRKESPALMDVAKVFNEDPIITESKRQVSNRYWGFECVRKPEQLREWLIAMEHLSDHVNIRTSAPK